MSDTIEHLKNMHHHPDATRLAALLSLPSIQNILLSDLRKPEPYGTRPVSGRLDGMTSMVLNHYASFTLLGFFIAAFLMVQKELDITKKIAHE